MSDRSRPWALPTALLIVCALLVWLLSPSRVAEPESHPLAQPSGAPPPLGSLGAAPSGIASGSAKYVDPGSTPYVPAAPPPVDLPPDTQKLTEEFVPGTTEWEEVPLLEKTPFVIRVMPRRYNVVVPDPIVVYLEIIDRSKNAPVKPTRAYVRLKPYDAKDSDPWVEVIASDDGTNNDEKAGDGRYTASYAATGTELDRMSGHVLVEGVVETAKAGIRRVPHTVIYTRGPRARLTGKWRDEIKDGHLVIEGELEVDEPGMFSVMGQLVGPEREPIALTRTYPPPKLEKGTHWITLRTWGKAITDTGIDGPYQLVNVLLTRDQNAKGGYDPAPTIALAHKTKPYSFSQFSKTPWTEPVATGPIIGPDHPSQKDNPPPMLKESDRASLKWKEKPPQPKPPDEPDAGK